MNIYDMVDGPDQGGWNDAGTTFTAIKMDVTDTASAAASKLLDLLVGGSSRASIRKDGLISSVFGLSIPTNDAVIRLGASEDVILRRDGGATLALRNGTTPQGLRPYNTWTDATNFERGQVGWVSNVFQIGTTQSGTGSARAMEFLTAGVSRWTVQAAGHFVPGANNSYDLGTISLRMRAGYFAGTLSFGTHSALGGESVTGFITITDAGGTSRKLAVVS